MRLQKSDMGFWPVVQLFYQWSSFNPSLEKPEPPKETKQPEKKPVKKLIVEVEKEPLKTLEYVINDKNELYMTISIRIGTVFHFLVFRKSDQSYEN